MGLSLPALEPYNFVPGERKRIRWEDVLSLPAAASKGGPHSLVPGPAFPLSFSESDGQELLCHLQTHKGQFLWSCDPTQSRVPGFGLQAFSHCQ